MDFTQQKEVSIFVKRFASTDKGTLGILSFGPLLLAQLEDPHHQDKIPGDTRIPAGRYRLTLQKTGRLHNAYSKYPWYRGMLLLNGVPNFSGVMIHSGNTKSDTRGCPLVGVEIDLDSFSILKSRIAMERLYTLAYQMMDQGAKVFIDIS